MRFRRTSLGKQSGKAWQLWPGLAAKIQPAPTSIAAAPCLEVRERKAVLRQSDFKA